MGRYRLRLSCFFCPFASLNHTPTVIRSFQPSVRTNLTICPPGRRLQTLVRLSPMLAEALCGGEISV